jgi:hypothetical protein
MVKCEGYYLVTAEERMFYQETLLSMLYELDIEVEVGNKFENDIFLYEDYNWGTEEDGTFKYKPSGLVVRFYKYPLRASEFSEIVSPKKWLKLIKHCSMCSRDLKEIDKTHKDYAICKCGHEQINTSTIDQCNKCQEFFKLDYPNRKTNYSEVASKYLEE